METSRIKWDESMAERCLKRCRNAGVQSAEEGRKPVQKTASDIQWEDFEKALNRAARTL